MTSTYLRSQTDQLETIPKSQIFLMFIIFVTNVNNVNTVYWLCKASSEQMEEFRIMHERMFDGAVPSKKCLLMVGNLKDLECKSVNKCAITTM